MVVCAPLIPCVVDPLVVTLALVTLLSVRVVSICLAVSTFAVASELVALVAKVLIVSSIGLDVRSRRWLLLLATIETLIISTFLTNLKLIILKPRVNRDNAESEDERFEHFLFFN